MPVLTIDYQNNKKNLAEILNSLKEEYQKLLQSNENLIEDEMDNMDENKTTLNVKTILPFFNKIKVVYSNIIKSLSDELALIEKSQNSLDSCLKFFIENSLLLEQLSNLEAFLEELAETHIPFEYDREKLPEADVITNIHQSVKMLFNAVSEILENNSHIISSMLQKTSEKEGFISKFDSSWHSITKYDDLTKSDEFYYFYRVMISLQHKMLSDYITSRQFVSELMRQFHSTVAFATQLKEKILGHLDSNNNLNPIDRLITFKTFLIDREHKLHNILNLYKLMLKQINRIANNTPYYVLVEKMQSYKGTLQAIEKEIKNTDDLLSYIEVTKQITNIIKMDDPAARNDALENFKNEFEKTLLKDQKNNLDYSEEFSESALFNNYLLAVVSQILNQSKPFTHEIPLVK